MEKTIGKIVVDILSDSLILLGAKSKKENTLYGTKNPGAAWD